MRLGLVAFNAAQRAICREAVFVSKLAQVAADTVGEDDDDDVLGAEVQILHSAHHGGHGRPGRAADQQALLGDEAARI